MSAIVLALSASANTSLMDAPKAADTLSKIAAAKPCAFSTLNFIYTAATIRASIDSETAVWRTNYHVIANSAQPEAFFGRENIDALNISDLIVRGSESALKGQIDRFLSIHGDTIDPEVKTSLRDLRVSVATLRKTITDFIRLNNQLAPISNDDRYADQEHLTSEKVNALLSATAKLYV
jgi:hypothetical protein